VNVWLVRRSSSRYRRSAIRAGGTPETFVSSQINAMSSWPGERHARFEFPKHGLAANQAAGIEK
jgi:hypothetical protein